MTKRTILSESFNWFSSFLFIQKLSRRLSTLQKLTTPLSETDKAKAREMSSLEALKYMSSEESKDDMDATVNGLKPRKVKRLPWERNKLKIIKVGLDEEYFKGLFKRQQGTSAPPSLGIIQIKLTPLPHKSPGESAKNVQFQCIVSLRKRCLID